jgi:hypothetical protein
MEIQFHGALQPTVNICFSFKNKIILDLYALNAKNNIVSIVDVIGIKI